KRKRYGQEWQLGETLYCSIGQSYVLTSTMQLAVAFGAIANNGKVLHPYVVKEITDAQGNVVKSSTPEVISEIQFKNPKTLKYVKEGLYQVVNAYRGTASYRRGQGIIMAG